MKVIFMGTPQFSVKILEDLHKEYPVSLVVTQPDKYVGRKKVLTYSPVKEKAIELGIDVFQPYRIRDDYQEIIDLKPDIIITAAYGQIIPQAVLDAPILGAINVHGSLLPKLRGGAPIQRAIKRMHEVTGITIMYMAMKMDSGDIISHRSIPITKEDTSGTMFEKLSVLGSELLLETLPSIINKTNNRIKQNPEEVTYAYNLKREEEQINWDQSVEQIDAHLRAFSPEPLIYSVLDSKQLKIHRLSYQVGLTEAQSQKQNGTILIVQMNQVGVKAQNGIIFLEEVQLTGKNPQPIKQFMNGAGRTLFMEDKIFQ
jgi:methionyl-tRNA formyltransferase